MGGMGCNEPHRKMSLEKNMMMVTAAGGSAQNQDQSLIHLCGLWVHSWPILAQSRSTAKRQPGWNTIDRGDHGGRNRKPSWWKAQAVQEENVPRSHCLHLPDPQRVLLSVSMKAWLNMTPSLLQMAHSLKVIQQVVFYHRLPWWVQLHPHTLDSPVEPTLPRTSWALELWAHWPPGTSACGDLAQAHAVPLALADQLNLGQELRPSHSLSEKPDKSMTELTEATVNSADAQKPPVTHLSSLGFWLQPRSGSPPFFHFREITASVVPVFPVPQGQ